jgi:general transcription factor 3C polypeptide 6
MLFNVLLSLSDAPPKPVRDGMAPLKEKKGKQASNSQEAPAPSKEVKQLASVQKILRFRSIGEDHQEHRTYQHEGKEF